MDDPIVLAASALVRPDGFHQVGRASIVEEEDALPDAPKRSRPELVRAGGALRNAVGEAFAHVVNQQVGEKVRCLVRQCSAWDRRRAAGNHLTRGQRRRVAMGAADIHESRSSVRNGVRVGRGRGRVGIALFCAVELREQSSSRFRRLGGQFPRTPFTDPEGQSSYHRLFPHLCEVCCL